MAELTCEHIDAVRHAARAQGVGLWVSDGAEPELLCSACGVYRVIPRALAGTEGGGPANKDTQGGHSDTATPS